MLNGLLARKIGMTQIFEEDGTALPVTVSTIRTNDGCTKKDFG